MAASKKPNVLAQARETIRKLKEVNREQLDRVQDYYMLKKLREQQDKELESLRFEVKQLEGIIEKLRERLRKYEPNA
jgi:hypothetical protein